MLRGVGSRRKPEEGRPQSGVHGKRPAAQHTPGQNPDRTGPLGPFCIPKINSRGREESPSTPSGPQVYYDPSYGSAALYLKDRTVEHQVTPAGRSREGLNTERE